ncbi:MULTISPECIES: PilX N-terminal domain-containing pilus assembly protein [Pseudomonas]|uniref:PilX N-terminal domain-containing pilus assembly protein n=1 Tax=Pseudomonas TaxID=286 RepID=UPI0023D807EE|nr:PilX N-terminal domain-containing pilus assembly protein [Pseudomonas sp. PSE14]WEJ71150.1 PilX N-terminal domain-containing pilus assembly protein [Pseudomonas sp. PSE14]
MMKGPDRQAGTALVVALLMLVVMTLLGISAINSSTVNQGIIFNAQTQQAAEAAAQDGIEQAISSIDAFRVPTSQTLTVTGLTVNVSAPVCIGTQVRSGYSLTTKFPPEDTNWELSATVDDQTTSSKVVLRQGVSIVMPSGSCPPL